MRRAIVIWFAFVLACLFGVTALRLAPGPDLNETAQVASSPEGTVYLLASGSDRWTVYGADETGTMTYYRTGSASKERVSCIGCGVDGTLYMVLEDRDPQAGAGWRLVRLTREGTEETIVRGSKSTLSQVDAVMADAKGVYVSGSTGSGTGRAVYGVSLPVEAGGTAELTEVRAGGSEVAFMGHAGGVSYGLMRDGGAAIAGRTGLTRYTEAESAVYTKLWTDGVTGFLYDSATGLIYEGTGQSLRERQTVDPSFVVIAGAGGKETNLSLLGRRVTDGQTVLLLESEEQLLEYEALGVPLRMQVERMGTEFWTWGVFALGGAVLIALAAVGWRKSRQVATKLGFAGALGVLALTMALTGIANGYMSRDLTDRRLMWAQTYGQLQAQALEGIDLSALTEEGFYGSQLYEELSAQLEARTVEGEGATVALESILLTVTEGEVKIGISQEGQYGAPVEGVYETGLLDLVLESAEGTPVGGVIEAAGVRQAVWAAPMTRGGTVQGVLVTALRMEDLSGRLLETQRTLWIAGCIVSAAAMALVMLIARRVMRPMGQIKKQMERMAEGELAISGEGRSGDDDLGSLWRTLKEMSVSLAIREYESKNMLQSYYRFVPRGLSGLLDKVSIMDVLFGDVTRTEGNVCVATVQNRHEVRRRVDDNGFMAFVNESFREIDESVSRHNGMLLSGSFDLAGVRSLYLGSGEEALAAGMDLVSGDRQDQRQGGVRPQMFVMLHRTTFLYGVAGTQEKAFPFMASSELDFLSGYAEAFRQTGTVLVMTEQARGVMKGPVAARYIGFVSSGDGRYAFKLYEGLTVYPDTERQGLEQQAERFEEALRLFYKSDFYLARNLFSGIMKACPYDGIARWYMFACERLFNRADPSQVRYDLFGSEE